MYILTVMNVVSTLYHDASIGNAINIVMVKVILLEDQMENAKFPSSSRANVTLKNFCRWQKHINPKEDHHPEHHDAAVLITRYSLKTNYPFNYQFSSFRLMPLQYPILEHFFLKNF
jgi:hypothetical protein